MLVDRPLFRVPQLAIHLDREISTTGCCSTRSSTSAPCWGWATPTAGAFERAGGRRARASRPTTVLAWDLMLHDVTPSRVIGVDGELVSAPRLDNLCSSWAGLEALLADRGRRGRRLGSRAAAGPVRPRGDRLDLGSRGRHPRCSLRSSSGSSTRWAAARDDHLRALAGSVCLSADMAHATHPNYAGAPRARPPDRAERRTGAEGQQQPPLRAPTPPAPPRSCWPASRPRCRCSATPTAATCPAARRSAPSPRRGSGSHRRRRRTAAGDAPRPRALRVRGSGPLRRRHGRLPRPGAVSAAAPDLVPARSWCWASDRRRPGPRSGSAYRAQIAAAHPDRAGGDTARAALGQRGLRRARASPPPGWARADPGAAAGAARAAAGYRAHLASPWASRPRCSGRHGPPRRRRRTRRSRGSSRPATASATVTYVDRSCSILEVLVRVEGEGTCSLVITTQGRAEGTDAFCTLEAIEHVASPPVRPVVEALVQALRRG